jgi:hypothetical protein
VELLEEIEKETEDVVTTDLQNELNQCYQATLTNRRVVPFLDNKRRGIFISQIKVFIHICGASTHFSTDCIWSSLELQTFVFLDFNPVFSHVFGISSFVRFP